MTKEPKGCHGCTLEPSETEALLEILEQGEQEVNADKVKLLADVVSTIKLAAYERGLEQLKAMLLVGMASEQGQPSDEHLSELRSKVKNLGKKGGGSN